MFIIPGDPADKTAFVHSSPKELTSRNVLALIGFKYYGPRKLW
jgi:hypothetical protein